jgi:hypothetical protein
MYWGEAEKCIVFFKLSIGAAANVTATKKREEARAVCCIYDKTA